MADPHAQQNPASPISSLLRTLGLTREDLMAHTEQMRAYLSQGSSSQPLPECTSETRSLRRSRTISFPSSFRKNTSPTPPKTPVKAEPVEHAISGRQMDTMERILEGRSRQARKEKRGLSAIQLHLCRDFQCALLSLSTESKSRSRDSRRVSQAHNVTPSRSQTPQVSTTRQNFPKRI